MEKVNSKAEKHRGGGFETSAGIVSFVTNHTMQTPEFLHIVTCYLHVILDFLNFSFTFFATMTYFCSFPIKALSYDMPVLIICYFSYNTKYVYSLIR